MSRCVRRLGGPTASGRSVLLGRSVELVLLAAAAALAAACVLAASLAASTDLGIDGAPRTPFFGSETRMRLTTCSIFAPPMRCSTRWASSRSHADDLTSITPSSLNVDM